MYREKLLEISNKIKEDKVLYFRLYNVLYMISFSNNAFTIRQHGLNIIHTYSTLRKLFNEYIIYGSALINLIDDIKYVNN